jgi:putative photosynthetic complex assembly protein 2
LNEWPSLLAASALVLLLWWTSTGFILYLGGLPRVVQSRCLSRGSLALALALLVLALTRNQADIAGAALAFCASLAVWAWAEMAFLFGFVTGPRRTGCPTGLRPWQRFSWAFQTLAYHELSLCVLGAAVLAATWGGSQTCGWWTFGALYFMRLSSKLQLFLGVRNRYEMFLPAALAHLPSYFGSRTRNRTFWPAVVALAALNAWAFSRALAGGPQGAAWAFLAPLLALGLIEHLMLALPWHAERLWRFSLRARERRAH